MPNTLNLPPGEFFQGIFIGKSGTRKSTAASSFPKPYYMIDFERRFAALRGKDIDFDYYSRAKGWGPAERKFEGFMRDSERGTLKYKTIHIASITSVMRFFLATALVHYKDETKGGFYIQRGGGADPLLMTDQPHFKFVHRALDELIEEYLLPLRCNVIIEAHEQCRYDKEGNIIGKKMLASDSLAEYLPTKFDETWEFISKRSQKKNSYHVRFRGELAKTTYRELPEEVEITDKEDVFYEEIFMQILKEKNK